MNTNHLLVFLALFATTGFCPAQEPFFTVPYDSVLYLSPVGGDAGAITEFGLGTSPADTIPIFQGLPGNPVPPTEVEVGFFASGSVMNFYEKTDWGSTYWAFSVDTTTDGSRCAFMDLDNSLGLGGSIVEPTGPGTWTLHLDDAASYMIDDDDNDILIQMRLAPVPEPATTLLASASLLLLYRLRRSG